MHDQVSQTPKRARDVPWLLPSLADRERGRERAEKLRGKLIRSFLPSSPLLSLPPSAAAAAKPT